MSHNKKIYVGQGVKVRAKFRDPENNELVTPANVQIRFRGPLVTLGAEVINPETGIYTGRVIMTHAGIWTCMVSSSDPGAAVAQYEFMVHEPVLAAV